jgi:translation initiation factor eIF-2B subunit epsilon
MSGEDSNGSHLERDEHHHHHHHNDFEHLYGEEMGKKFAEQLHLGPGEECSNAQSVGAGGKGYRWICPSFRTKSLVPGVVPKKRTYPNEMKGSNNKVGEIEVKKEANASGDKDEDKDDEMEEDSDSDSDADERHFHKEVSETFLRALRDDTIDENVTVELQGLKMAENRTFADIARYVLCAMFALSMPPTAKCDKQFRKLFPTEFPSDANECVSRVKKHVKRYAPLLAKFLKSEDDQVEVLLTLEEFCAEEGAFKDCQGKHVANAFAKILHLLYDADVLSESAVLAWADEKDDAEEKDLVFLKKAAPFVKWLREAESESEDDESSDEED